MFLFGEFGLGDGNLRRQALITSDKVSWEDNDSNHSA
jgi:hypothetical protein